jgi:hypothetical protein
MKAMSMRCPHCGGEAAFREEGMIMLRALLDRQLASRSLTPAREPRFAFYLRRNAHRTLARFTPRVANRRRCR